MRDLLRVGGAFSRHGNRNSSLPSKAFNQFRRHAFYTGRSAASGAFAPGAAIIEEGQKRLPSASTDLSEDGFEDLQAPPETDRATRLEKASISNYFQS
jgi:hypothetical protein